MKSKTSSREQIENSLESTLLLLGDRWTLRIVQSLLSGTKRYNGIKAAISGITSRTLTKHLRELEQHGLLTRKITDDRPPHSEYTLTNLGRSLEPCCQELVAWGKKFAKQQRSLDSKQSGISKKKSPIVSQRKSKRKHN